MLKFQSIKPRPPKQFRLFRSLNAQVNSKRQPSSPEKNTFVFKEPFGIQKNQLFRFLSMGMISCSMFMLCSSLSFAQNQTSSLEEIVIVANRVPIPIKKVGSSVSILNLEEIQARGNISLTDLLRQTPAIGVTSNGGVGATSALRIRGEEGFRTLTLFDGLKLSDPSGPQVTTPIEHILTSGLGRVEILRGPQGLSYGADAGGIINISSRQSDTDMNITLDGQSGSRGTQQVSAIVTEGSERVNFTLIANNFKSDGYNVRESDTQVADDDGYENISYHARVGFKVSNNWLLEIVQRNVEGVTQYDGCFAGSTVYDCLAVYDLNASRASLAYTSPSFTHSLGFSNTKTNREDLALGNLSFSSKGELSRWEYVASASNLPGVDLVFGIDLEQEENDIMERDNKGVYVELLSDFSDSLFLSAGVRQDDNNDFGQHDSYRLSSAYLLALGSSTLKLKASYGSGFRSPSLFEIAYNSGPFSAPPASLVSLKEETSKGFEIGLEFFASEQLNLETVIFVQEIEDAIYFDLSGFSGYLQDIGKSTSEGVELSGNYTLDDQWELSANYTYNETERPNGSQRLRRPERLANLGISYRNNKDRLRVHFFYRISRNSIDEVFGSAIPLDDFEVLDLTASYQVSERLELYGRIENGLNESYSEVTDFLAPERASYLGLRVNF